MSTARGMLGALAGESLSLDVAVGAGGPRWYVRTANSETLERALVQLRAAYPQAEVERGAGDPATLLPGEHATTVELRPAADMALPIRLDWRNERDPLAGVLAAVEPVDGERIICRLSLRSASSRTSDQIRRREAQPAYARRDSDRGSPTSLTLIIALMALVAAPLFAAVAVRLFRDASRCLGRWW